MGLHATRHPTPLQPEWCFLKQSSVASLNNNGAKKPGRWGCKETVGTMCWAVGLQNPDVRLAGQTTVDSGYSTAWQVDRTPMQVQNVTALLFSATWPFLLSSTSLDFGKQSLITFKITRFVLNRLRLSVCRDCALLFRTVVYFSN